MALTDKVEIVFSNSNRKKKVLISWLLSESAMFAMEANQFIITDTSIKNKVEGETFMGQPAKPQLIMRYPYLRTIFSNMEEQEVEEIEDAEETVLEEVLNEPINLSELSVDQLKSICDEREIEYDGRKRKPEYFIELIEQNGN
jgi:hypothetical protein